MATVKKAAKGAAKISPTAGGIDPLAPQVTPAQPKLSNEELATFDFAVNVVKLNRAKAYVNANTPGLKGKDLVEAVKERYVELGGLLSGDKPTGKAPKGKKNVVNLADEDAE